MLTLKDLYTLSELVKIAPLAQRAGLHPNRLAFKKTRKLDLTPEERSTLTTQLRQLARDINEAIK